jgi:hypothetical protein
VTENERVEPGFGRLERQHAEVEAPLRNLCTDLPGRDTPDVDVNKRVGGAKLRDEGQHRVDRCFVGPDQHPAAAEVAQILDRAFRLLGQPQEPIGVVAEEPAGIGQRGVLRRSIEQPFADTILQPPHGLADRRLRPVELHGCTREAAFSRNLQENAQFAQFHDKQS